MGLTLSTDFGMFKDKSEAGTPVSETKPVQNGFYRFQRACQASGRLHPDLEVVLTA
jgi:hypothetical protein